MTYDEIGETLTGIDLALVGDSFFGESGAQSQRQILRDVVAAIKKNEAEKNGLTEDQVFELPPETELEPSSVELWEEACRKADATRQ